MALRPHLCQAEVDPRPRPCPEAVAPVAHPHLCLVLAAPERPRPCLVDPRVVRPPHQWYCRTNCSPAVALALRLHLVCPKWVAALRPRCPQAVVAALRLAMEAALACWVRFKRVLS